MGAVCSSSSNVSVPEPSVESFAPISSEPPSEVDEATILDEDLSFLANDADMNRAIEVAKKDKEAAVAASSADPDEVVDTMETAQTQEFLAIKPWLGALVAPSVDPRGPDPDAVPDKTLDLEFVHGYRCHDARNNLYYNIENRLVYHSAGVGIVYDPEQNSQKFFFGHTDDIICLAMHPEGKLAVSGQMGKWPRICVWDTTTMEQVAVFKGFLERAVVSVDFSHDGRYIAAVGLDDQHSVAVYDLQEGTLVATGKGDQNKVLEVRWNNIAKDYSFMTVGVKHIKMWQLQDGKTLTSSKGIFGKNGSIQTLVSVAFHPTAGTITTTSTGQLYLWKGNNLTGSVATTHEGPVLTVAVSADGKVVSGGQDGQVIVYDSNLKSIASHKPSEGAAIRSLSIRDGYVLIGTLKSQIFTAPLETVTDAALLLQAHYEELWGLTIKNGSEYITCCDDKTVRIWNVSERKQTAEGGLPEMGRCTGISPDGSIIAVGLKDGKVCIMDSATLARKKTIKHRKEEISQVKFSPDGTKLAVGSHDNFVDVYDVANDFTKIGTCSGHHSYITHLDWSADSSVIQTNSGDYELLFWNASSCTQITGATSLRDTLWAEWTCTLGWPVQGVYPPFSDGTDVNSVCKSNDATTLASAEDTGLVKLYKWPCIGSGFDSRGRISRRPNAKSFPGHSSHVTNIRWSPDDKYVISTGGNDRSIFQWIVV